MKITHHYPSPASKPMPVRVDWLGVGAACADFLLRSAAHRVACDLHVLDAVPHKLAAITDLAERIGVTVTTDCARAADIERSTREGSVLVVAVDHPTDAAQALCKAPPGQRIIVQQAVALPSGWVGFLRLLAVDEPSRNAAQRTLTALSSVTVRGPSGTVFGRESGFPARRLAERVLRAETFRENVRDLQRLSAGIAPEHTLLTVLDLDGARPLVAIESAAWHSPIELAAAIRGSGVTLAARAPAAVMETLPDGRVRLRPRFSLAHAVQARAVVPRPELDPAVAAAALQFQHRLGAEWDRFIDTLSRTFAARTSD